MARKLRKRYKKQKCAFHDADNKQCTRNAVGKSTLCKKHGGNPIVKEHLISPNDDSLIVVTKFNPAVHPMEFIRMSREGLSPVEIAAQFEVGAQTLIGWSEKFIEFATAFEVGQALYESWWLQQGRDGLTDTRNFNTTLFKFLTGNKLGYADKIESKNLNVNAHGVLLVPDKMSIDEWEDFDGDVIDASS